MGSLLQVEEREEKAAGEGKRCAQWCVCKVGRMTVQIVQPSAGVRVAVPPPCSAPFATLAHTIAGDATNCEKSE